MRFHSIACRANTGFFFVWFVLGPRITHRLFLAQKLLLITLFVYACASFISCYHLTARLYRSMLWCQSYPIIIVSYHRNPFLRFFFLFLLLGKYLQTDWLSGWLVDWQTHGHKFILMRMYFHIRKGWKFWLIFRVTRHNKNLTAAAVTLFKVFILKIKKILSIFQIIIWTRAHPVHFCKVSTLWHEIFLETLPILPQKTKLVYASFIQQNEAKKWTQEKYVDEEWGEEEIKGLRVLVVWVGVWCVTVHKVRLAPCHLLFRIVENILSFPKRFSIKEHKTYTIKGCMRPRSTHTPIH